jgi:hypothetical protein
MERRNFDKTSKKHFLDSLSSNLYDGELPFELQEIELPQPLAEPVPPSTFQTAEQEISTQFIPDFYEALDLIPSFEDILKVLECDDADVNDDCDADAESLPETPLTLSLSEELLIFFVIFNVSHSTMTYLLQLLSRHHINVPPTLYKLKKIKGNIDWNVLNINNGQFGYLSLQESIIYCIKNGLLRLKSGTKKVILDLKLNIDGLPLYKSSSLSLWPILCTIADVVRPLPLAVFCGIGKPDLDVFMKNLCEELHLLKDEGFVYMGCRIVVGHVLLVCDAPARSYLQCVKGHGSYQGCAYCQITGIRCEGRVVFPYGHNNTRTDVAYDNMAENNQLRLSPLVGLVRLNSDFPPEYMHSVCLGIVRKLFKFYVLPNKGVRLPCKLSVVQQICLSDLIIKTAKFTPSEFQRRLRSLKEFPHFKATEFRSLVLYFGPYLLKSFLPSEYYEHFVLLHFAIYVFASSRLNHLHSLAARCINIFVYKMPQLFGLNSMSYNVHIIQHLYEFVRMYGPLDNYSAFPYENLLSIIKRRIRPTRYTFQQTLHVLSDIRDIYANEPSKSALYFSDKSPNNCAVLEDGTIVLITSSVSSESTCAFVGQELIFSRNLYTYPYESHVLQIGYYSLTRKILSPVHPVSKAVCIPINSEFLIIPYA